jgi:hypothetical protein
MKRRKFLKLSSISFLGFSLLPKLKLFATEEKRATPKNKSSNRFWLSGSPRYGCSTSCLSIECCGSLENGLDDFYSFRVPQNFLDFHSNDLLA